MSINWQDELQHSTGEIFEPEPQEESDAEMDLQVSGPTFAEAQSRLARTISDLTEYVFAAPKERKTE